MSRGVSLIAVLDTTALAINVARPKIRLLIFCFIERKMNRYQPSRKGIALQ
jgi:hypothetical protein